MANDSIYRQYYFNYIDYRYGYNEYNNIKHKINDLYLNIEKNILQFPVLNDNNLEIFNGSNFTNLPFIEFLFSYDSATNSYKGFNQVKINEIIKDPLNLYSNIENNCLQYFIRLKNAYMNLNSNLYYIKQFQEFYTQFQLTEENFYTYALTLSKSINSSVQVYDFSIMAYIIAEEFLLFVKKKVFEKINYNLKKSIYQTSPSNIQNIQDSFNRYIYNNKDDIEQKLSNYILTSILGLNNYSLDYQDKIKSKMTNLLTEIPILFSKYISTQITNTFQLLLIESVNTCIYDEFMRRNCVIDNTLFELSNIYDFSEDYLIFQDIQTYIMKNYKSTIESLEYITYQFIKSPVQFINSHLYVYNEFHQNNLNKEDIDVTFDFLSEEKVNVVLKQIVINNARISNIYLDEYAIPGGLDSDVEYYARVRCKRKAGEYSNWSNIFKFRTSDITIITNPTFNNIDVSLTPLLTLQSFKISNIIDHIDSRWQVSKDDTFSQSSIIADSINDLSKIHKTGYRVPDGILQKNTQYYCRVKYQNSENVWSNWSSLLMFLTVEYIDIQYPIDNDIHVSLNPTMKINNFINIERFSDDVNSHWQISTTNDFTNIIRDSEVLGNILPNINTIISNKSINQGCNKIYMNWIYSFIDSPDFEKYLFDFILNIKPDILSRFDATDNMLFDQMYSFRQFFKLLFSKHIYDNLLFYDETEKIILKYSEMIQLFSLTSNEIEKIKNDFRNPNSIELTNIKSKISNFYIETVISNIVLYIINSYGI